MERFLGIDVGAETVKVAELVLGPGGPALERTARVAHGKAPGPAVVEALAPFGWEGVAAAAATGRLGRQLDLPRIPAKQALAAGVALVHGPGPVTVVSIGARGFGVLEVREAGDPAWRESARCAQGTGNFLRQLVERFGLGVEEAAARAAAVEDPAPLSGRCPVILKTDMTHLANKGERQERILAGLFDAIAESAEGLVKPRRCPPRVLLAGGVALAARVRAHFARFLARSGMELLELDPDRCLLLEAAGAAWWASRHEAGARPRPPPLGALLRAAHHARVEVLPPLAAALARVRRLPPPPPAAPAADVVLGLDVGSTGSKAVALDAVRRAPVWSAYVRTRGDPVGAAQELVRRFLSECAPDAGGPAAGARVRGLGATGSGREIVGSLLATCYGPDAVFVVNEIAAHARGAVHHDPRVDTIFEIGGQDAKYVRLAGGRVVDAAMNEACSAGTGSFIEEQGRRFEGVPDVAALGAIAVEADGSAQLGQHCSIFMAEVIDEAVAAGVSRERIVAGLHESVIANYLNRVKGSRSVGEVVFCQGMPFAADALAAAVARQTGAEVIVPPEPGTTGALGIALLAAEAQDPLAHPALDPAAFLAARVEAKDTFVCKSDACGGGGNRCRIDRLTTRVGEERRRFTWGGGCALHDRGTRRRKLPSGAPDPFRERAARSAAAVEALGPPRGARTVALADELQLKGLLPFFATFVHGLGLDVRVVRGEGRAPLRRGAEAANVPFCAPMARYHGVVAAMAEGTDDVLLVPRVREIPRVSTERASQLCPIVQASADVVRWDLGPEVRARIVEPVFDVGPGALDAPALRDSCRALAAALGVTDERAWLPAMARAREAQRAFDADLQAIGRDALAWCAHEDVVPVVVLGRTYTLHDDVLNSNLPAILREQGAVAIPLDCYPVGPQAPLFPDMYWGHGQRMLRAAWQIRRTEGPYALLASNYSCGPDSFTQHPVAALLEGKPFAVIETDGHAGDAGTKTRVEAFLHCVREHRATRRDAPALDADRLQVRARTAAEVARTGETVLVPYMGPAAHVLSAALRGAGFRAEDLPEPDAAALAAGRRHTSGKECLPMVLTLGSLLERLRGAAPEERFAFFMPGTDGPCRFGAYRDLHQLVLDRLGLRERVSIWSPPFGQYFEGVSPLLGAIVFAGTVAMDLLRDLRSEVLAGARDRARVEAAYARRLAEVVAAVEAAAGEEGGVPRVLREAATGRGFGIPAIVGAAARELAALRGPEAGPLVLVVGEIYVRNVPFSNGRVVDALVERGIRARVSPVSEFLQYSEWAGARARRLGLGDRLEHWVRHRLEASCHAAAAAPMGWSLPPRIGRVVEAAHPYLSDALEGETVLTLGASLHAWRRREVDAVLSVGPLECMPNKLAETQFVHAGDREGLLSLTLSLQGDPIDPEPLDAFALDVKERWRARRAGGERVGRFVAARVE